MSKWTFVQVIAVALSLAGAYVSFNLLAKHLTGAAGPAWFEAGCNPGDGGGGANCDAVLASPYSYWPPKKDDESKKTGHIPVAFLGLVYFSMLAVWLIGVGRPSPPRRWILLLPLFFIVGGLLGSARFLYIMFAMIDEWCPWCLLTHVINVAIAICVVLMWPRAQRVAMNGGCEKGFSQQQGRSGSARQPTRVSGGARPTASLDEAEVSTGESGAIAPAASGPINGPATGPAHPSARLLLITLTAVVLVAFGQNEMLGKVNMVGIARNAKQGYDQCMVAVRRIQGDADKLTRNWQLADKRKFDLRPDDPTRISAPPGEKTVEVVVFSDFECPSCKKLATFIERQAQPLFDGHLKLIFKHYPLCTDCNDRIKKTMHKHACFAAAAAEAARILGGNDAFWRAHDYMFGHQGDLKRGKLTAGAIAAELGFGLVAFTEAMGSEEASTRIREDIDLAQSSEVVSTPTLFVSGRKVDTLARLVPEFWDRLAGFYWKSREGPRPESTRLRRSGDAGARVPSRIPRKGNATPGSQDQQAAP